MKNPRKKLRSISEPQLVDLLREQLQAAREEAVVARDANQQFAREKARRTDQYKALLQVASLLLAVASNEIVRWQDE